MIWKLLTNLLKKNSFNMQYISQIAVYITNYHSAALKNISKSIQYLLVQTKM